MPEETEHSEDKPTSLATTPKNVYMYSIMENVYTNSKTNKKQYNVRLTTNQIEFLKTLPRGQASDLIRQAIEDKITQTFISPEDQVLARVQRITFLKNQKTMILKATPYIEAKNLREKYFKAQSSHHDLLVELDLVLRLIKENQAMIRSELFEGNKDFRVIILEWKDEGENYKEAFHEIMIKRFDKRKDEMILLAYLQELNELKTNMQYYSQVVHSYETTVANIDKEISQLEQECIYKDHDAIQLYKKEEHTLEQNNNSKSSPDSV